MDRKQDILALIFYYAPCAANIKPVAQFLRIPRLAEANTPQPTDAAGECLLYDDCMASLLSWINRMSES